MRYESPEVFDLGSIGDHTWIAGVASGNCKGGGDPQHLDTFCEWSGGTDPDDPSCNGEVDPRCA